MLKLRMATALGLAAACTGSLAVAGAVGVPAAAADSVRDGQMWALNMMNVPEAWQDSKGQGVTVAVLDSGVLPEVSDLAGSVVTGPDLTGVGTTSTNADWGQHGTWMASIIAGHGHGLDSEDGITGVAPEAKILSVRVIPDRNDPGYSKYEREREDDVQNSLAKGITYAVNHGADVISMSIGYSSPSASVRSALQYAYGHGVAVVASSGNSGDTQSASKDGYAPLKFPADYPGVIGVAAVSTTGSVAGFSSNNLSVEVAAPGVNISAQGRDGQYWLVTGTSPACALVAGVAALIKAKYPGLAPDLVAKALSSTTHYRPAGGYDQEVGFGTVDATAALAAAGQLATQRAARTGSAASTNFGGGPSAAPADPVAPRGSGQLILFAVLALTTLALVAAAVSRLTVLNQLRRREHAGLSPGSVPVAGPSFGRPPPAAAARSGASPSYPPPRPGQAHQPDQAPEFHQAATPRRLPEPHPASQSHQPPEPRRLPEPHPASQAHQPPEPRPASQAHQPPEPRRLPEPHPASQAHQAPEPHQASPSHQAPEQPRTSQSHQASQPYGAPCPPQPSLSSPVPPPSAAQRSPASQSSIEVQPTRPLPIPHSPHQSRDSRRPGESRETHESGETREPRDNHGSRTPSGWWRPPDDDD